MLREECARYEHVVPLVAEKLIEEIQENISDSRNEMLVLQRQSILMTLVNREKQLPPPFPPRDKIIEVTSNMPDVIMQKVHPGPNKNKL